MAGYNEQTGLYSDNDLAFTINPTNKIITNTSGKTVIMQGDTNSEAITFVIDKNVDGCNLCEECNDISIHYYVIDSVTRRKVSQSLYSVEEVVDSTHDSSNKCLLHECSDNANKVAFSWVISDYVTQNAGVLYFSVVFKRIEYAETDIGHENPLIKYRWSTNINNSITIAPSINNDEVVAEALSDPLAVIKNDVITFIETADGIFTNKLQEVVDENLGLQYAYVARVANSEDIEALFSPSVEPEEYKVFVEKYYADEETITLYTDTEDENKLKIKIKDNVVNNLSDKQDKTDNELNTTNKTIVGAINELHAVPLISGNGTNCLKLIDNSEYPNYVEGENNAVFGSGNFVGGQTTKGAVAFGVSTGARAVGTISSGYRSSANGWASAALNNGTTASAPASTALGSYTTTTCDSQLVCGKFNSNVDDGLFIVGNGWNASNHRNAFVVKTDGSATLGKNPVNDMDIATKQYVDNVSGGGGGGTQLYSHAISIVDSSGYCAFVLISASPTACSIESFSEDGETSYEWNLLNAFESGYLTRTSIGGTYTDVKCLFMDASSSSLNVNGISYEDNTICSFTIHANSTTELLDTVTEL